MTGRPLESRRPLTPEPPCWLMKKVIKRGGRSLTTKVRIPRDHRLVHTPTINHRPSLSLLQRALSSFDPRHRLHARWTYNQRVIRRTRNCEDRPIWGGFVPREYRFTLTQFHFNCHWHCSFNLQIQISYEYYANNSWGRWYTSKCERKFWRGSRN